MFCFLFPERNREDLTFIFGSLISLSRGRAEYLKLPQQFRGRAGVSDSELKASLEVVYSVHGRFMSQQ